MLRLFVLPQWLGLVTGNTYKVKVTDSKFCTATIFYTHPFSRTSDHFNDENEVSVTPNPTSGLVTVHFEKSASHCSAKLFDVTGKLLFEKTLYRQALAPLQKAWQQKQGSYDIGMYLALSHYLIEQYAESEAVLLQIQQAPGASVGSLEYEILLGSARARLGNWDAAGKDLEDATRRFPQRADGYLNFGLFCVERGENARAMDLFEKASRLPGKGTKLLYTIRSRKDCEGLRPPGVLEHHDSLHGELYNQLAEQLQARQQRGSALEVFLLALDADNRSERA